MKNLKPQLAILFVFVVLVPLSQIGLANTQNSAIYIRADGTVEGTDKIQLEGNVYTFTDNVVNQSILVERDNVVVDGASFTLDGGHIWLENRRNVTITNIEIINSDEGIRIMGNSINNKIIENKISDIKTSAGNAIWIYLGASNNTISGNIISNNSVGIKVDMSGSTTISENYIFSNGMGIWLSGSQNRIVRNEIINNGIGVRDFIGGNLIQHNNFVNNSNFGIFLDGAGYNNIIGNTVIDNNVGINIRTCMNNLITQNNVSHNINAGISSFRSEKDVITYNSITDNGGNGIETESSMVSYIISENEILNNGLNGFQMDWASNATITKNRIQNNTENGIRVYESRNNTISKNNIDDNKANGIYLQTYSFLNLIFLNNITSNSEIGISNNQYSSDNLIHHNNFIDNGNQATTYTGETNRWGWDNGFPSGGNYWSDYKGTDSNEDGLGDTPYIINENNQDNYPLMNPVDIRTNQEFSTIPEFPSWTILLLFLTITLFSIIVKRNLHEVKVS